MSIEKEFIEVVYPQFVHDFAVKVYEHNQDPFKAAQIDNIPEEYLQSVNFHKLKLILIFLCLLYREVMHSRMEGK